MSKLTVHHLDNSRSQRILWLLEELGVDYDLEFYKRDPKTMRAPDTLKRIHPLGNWRRCRACGVGCGHSVTIYLEEEPGSSGKDVISHYARNVLTGFTFKAKRSTGSKADRAAPVASAAELGNVKLVQGPWISAFLDEVSAFPMGSHDDMVDALSGAFSVVFEKPFIVKSKISAMHPGKDSRPWV